MTRNSRSELLKKEVNNNNKINLQHAAPNTHHGNRLRVKHLLRAECGEVRQVGEYVHYRHDGQRDDDGAREVSKGRRERERERRREIKNGSAPPPLPSESPSNKYVFCLFQSDH